MPLDDPDMNASYRKYAELQLRRHFLLIEGGPDDDASLLEDQMETLWEMLDETQRMSLNGMASDLNWVRRDGEPAPKGPKTLTDVNQSDVNELVSAIHSKDWHKVLRLLRACVPTFLPAKLAYLRGTSYEAIQFLDYGSVFYERAAEIESDNAAIGVVAIRRLLATNEERAFKRAARIIDSPGLHPPAVLAMATVLTLRRHEIADEPIDRDRFSRLLQDAIKRLEIDLPPEPSQAMVYQLAASGFEMIGEPEEALSCYEKGLQAFPDNELLAVGRGLLQYGTQTDQAVDAFQRAVARGTRLVWPYFFLAHHYMVNAKYRDSLEILPEAWRLATTDPVRAELLEWQAICLSELTFPPEVIRSLFEKAVMLDSHNTRIARNFAAFNQAHETDRPRWGFDDAKVLRTQRGSRLQEFDLLAPV